MRSATSTCPTPRRSAPPGTPSRPAPRPGPARPAPANQTRPTARSRRGRQRCHTCSPTRTARPGDARRRGRARGRRLALAGCTSAPARRGPPSPPARWDRRRRVNVRRAVLHRRVRRLPAGPPRHRGQLRRRRQQRRASPASPPGRSNFGATDVPASPADLAGASGTTVQVPVDLGAVAIAYNAITNGNGPLQADRPGDRPDLPRPDHQAGTTPPSRPSTPAPSCPTPTSPSCTAPTAAAPPTSSATTCPRSAPPGPQQSAPAGRCAGPSASAPTATPAWPPTIARIPYSIGYTERSYVTGTNVGWAAVQNQAGNYVQPTTAAIAADAAGEPDITPEQLLHRQRARPGGLPDLRLQLGPALRPPAHHGRRESPHRAHQLAHPRRAGLRRQRRLRPPAPRRPAARHHQPQPRHRPRRGR